MRASTINRSRSVAGLLTALFAAFPEGCIQRADNAGTYGAIRADLEVTQYCSDSRIITPELARLIPPLYANEQVKDPLVVAKFFNPRFDWTWYVLEGSLTDRNGIRIEPGETNEGDPIDYTFFGMVYGFEAELGYFTLLQFEEIEQITGLPMERDLYFLPMPLSHIRSRDG